MQKNFANIEGSVEMHQATFSPKEKNTGEALGNPAEVPPDIYLRSPEGVWEVSSSFFSNKMVHP
jgi:hypothetical protein